MRLMEATSGQGVKALDLQEETEQAMVVQPEKRKSKGQILLLPAITWSEDIKELDSSWKCIAIGRKEPEKFQLGFIF